MDYYTQLFTENMKSETEKCRKKSLNELQEFRKKLNEFTAQHKKTFQNFFKPDS